MHFSMWFQWLLSNLLPEPVFVNLLKSTGIDSLPGGIGSSKVIPGLSIPSLAESLPRNRFLGSVSVYKYGLWFPRKFRINCLAIVSIPAIFVSAKNVLHILLIFCWMFCAGTRVIQPLSMKKNLYTVHLSTIFHFSYIVWCYCIKWNILEMLSFLAHKFEFRSFTSWLCLPPIYSKLG